MDDESANPYESPTAAGEVVSHSQPDAESDSWRLVTFWVIAYLANMPVPIMFGLQGTSAAGRVGMLLGIALILVLGAMMVRRSRLAGKIIARGSTIFALTQLMPVAQILAGMLALEVITSVGFENPMGVFDDDSLGQGGLGLAGGMLATLIVGTLIAICGAAIGGFLFGLTPRRWWRDTPTMDAADAYSR